eukprot:CAMPEP_0206511816 /NCGR_PEP_ID=MMETSP0324_2-20121206/60492_1 /ASSEMBLY_ACC=CAM_ASM_000836 /TAXON_ID=2866 /ORGANISM="Crypthecodinium cohnii, Strain Seligo" /LENGTH=160 /DNA_ID=CAMNT_0054003621 /DNA_START=371 /DNA_END=849 /DNA_ORIENTATION=-
MLRVKLGGMFLNITVVRLPLPTMALEKEEEGAAFAGACLGAGEGFLPTFLSGFGCGCRDAVGDSCKKLELELAVVGPTVLLAGSSASAATALVAAVAGGAARAQGCALTGRSAGVACLAWPHGGTRKIDTTCWPQIGGARASRQSSCLLALQQSWAMLSV